MGLFYFKFHYFTRKDFGKREVFEKKAAPFKLAGTLFPVIIEQVLISAYLIKKSRIYTEYMENKMIFERYQHLFDYHGKHSTKRTV